MKSFAKIDIFIKISMKIKAVNLMPFPPHSLTAPLVNPLTRYLCRERNNITMGIIPRSDAAVNNPHSVSYGPVENAHKPSA
jgi:hypothetical protein